MLSAMLAVLGPPAIGSFAGWSVAKHFEADDVGDPRPVPVTTFDKTKLQASINANGFAWVIYPGPPFLVWQLAEVDAVGDVQRMSSAGVESHWI